MIMIRCIAIDDEPLALQQLERFLQRIPELELIGTYYSADDAQPLIADGKADLIFLDIDMPDCNGVDFARSLGPRAPYVVFTTAYPQYAPEGFRLDAVDYLLKPLSFSELLEAVEKVKRRQREEADMAEADTHFYVKSGGMLMRIDRRDILYVKGMGEYVQIKLKDTPGHVVTLESMRHYEELLKPAGFVRIHKSYIVNLAYIDKAGSSHIEIAGETFPIGNTYKASFRERFIETRNA